MIQYNEYFTRLSQVDTPCYVIDENLLIRNLETLKDVSDATGCKILLAQKAYALYQTYPLLSRYLSGTCASSLHEAMLGREHFGGEVHIFAPAYRDEEFPRIVELCDHIVFNSYAQWRRHRDALGGRSMGIRVNPEYSEIETQLYNPCARGSRFGVKAADLRPDMLEAADGIHFHVMCEQNADVLERVLEVFEQKFGQYLHKMQWLNIGGGHHITRPDYDVDLLKRLLIHLRDTYDVRVYCEPGEAVVLNTGYMVTRVLDVVENDMRIAICDASMACHMPDIGEMPYTPGVIGADAPGIKPHTYRLGGNTCLSGDVIGDFSFDEPLEIGDTLILGDMSHYTFVKNNTFNGINLPSIAMLRDDGIEVVKRFGYEDFKSRL